MSDTTTETLPNQWDAMLHSGCRSYGNIATSTEMS